MNEFAKFLSGFFFALIIINICALLSNWLPITILGFVFEYSLWTGFLVGFIFLAMVFALLGWGNIQGKKVSSSIFITFLLFSLGAVAYLFEGNQFRGKASLIDTKEEFKILEIEPEDSTLEKEMFTMSFGNGKNDSGTAIMVDNDGNIVASGYFQGTIDLDYGTGVMERTSLGGSINDNAVDIYLAKYTQSGRLIWGFSLGSVGTDIVNSLKSDKEGNIYITGYFGGQMDADPTGEESLINSGTGRDGFLIKYNKDGKLMWAKSFGNTETIPFSENDNRFEEGIDVAISDNYIYLLGVFEGKIDLDNSDPNKFADTFESYDRDTFIAKYDLQGNFIKATSLSGKGITQGQGIRVDNEENLYVAGFFDGKIKIGESSLASAGSFDCFLTKLNKDFTPIFSKRWGSSQADKVSGRGIEIDDNNIYIVGDFNQTIYLGDYKIASKGSTDVFFAKFNKEGAPSFIKSIGGVYNDSVLGLSKDKENNILFTGYFKDSVDFDASKGVYFLQPNSYGEASDIFVTKYSSSGEFLWARNFGGYVSLSDEIQSGNGLAVDLENNPIITGKFYDAIDFHSTEDLNLKSNGKGDAFIVKYNKEGEIE